MRLTLIEQIAKTAKDYMMTRKFSTDERRLYHQTLDSRSDAGDESGLWIITLQENAPDMDDENWDLFQTEIAERFRNLSDIINQDIDRDFLKNRNEFYQDFTIEYHSLSSPDWIRIQMTDHNLYIICFFSGQY